LAAEQVRQLVALHQLPEDLDVLRISAVLYRRRRLEQVVGLQYVMVGMSDS
jgi:hypothetical protein